MPLEEHRELSGSELAAGLVLVDPLLFRLYFFKSDLEIAPSCEQKLIFCDESERVLLCTGRKVAKTIHLEAFLLQHGLTWESEGITEAMMFTPSDVHLVPFLDRVVGRINDTPLIKGMVKNMRRGDSPLIEFATGLRWYLRIEGLSGKDNNMVGLRAALIVGDECMPAGTLVYTWFGPKPIETLKSGDSIYSAANEGIVLTSVSGVKNQGKRAVYEIKTPTRKIKMTGNHPVLCAKRIMAGRPGDPKTSKSVWELEWTKCEALNKGDAILIANGVSEDHEQPWAGDDLLKLVGMFLGDGTLSMQTSRGKKTGRWQGIHIATPEGDKAREEAVRILSTLSRNKVSLGKNTVSTSDTELANSLDKLGMKNGAIIKEIPDWCFALSERQKRILLEGIFVTDGYLNGNTWYLSLASEKLINGVRALAVMCGLRVSNIYHSRKQNPFYENKLTRKEFVESYTLTIKEPGHSKGAHNYNQEFPRGLDRIEIPDATALDKVRSVEYVGDFEVWDIETDSGNFIAEGVIVHNCAFGNWVCHNSRLQTALPNCKWLYAGVPSGIRNSPFYALDQQLEGRGWSWHKYPTFINPIYSSKKAREQLAEDYGGVETQGYKTQVLGEWGEEVISSFPPGSFNLHPQPYYHKAIYASKANADLENIALLVGFPSLRCHQFAIGWDYGYSPDPSEVFGFYRSSEADHWRVYCRLTLRRIALQHQVEFVLHLVRHIFNGEFVGLSTDKADAIQILQGQAREYDEKFLWANPAGVTAVSVRPDDPNQAEVYRHLSEADKKSDFANIPNKEFYVNLLKGWLVNAAIGLEGRKLELGNDAQVANELITTTEKKTIHGRTMYYGPPDPDRRSVSLDHNFDALSYGCHAIWAGMQNQATTFSEAALLSVMGWVGGGSSEREWRAPYGNN